MALTTRFGIEIPDVGLDNDQWGDILNAYFNALESRILAKLIDDSYAGELTTTSTKSIQVPVGSTEQRPTGLNGKIRYNTTLGFYEGYSGTAWGRIGSGATGGGSDAVFVENDQIITQSYTIPTGRNASSVGPITINDGAVVTVPDNSVWVVL